MTRRTRSDTIGITGASGQYLNHYAYLPFGQATTTASELPNAFEFAGQWGVTSDSVGSEFMGVRSYDPATGQFAQNDPAGLAGGDLNIRRQALTTNRRSSLIPAGSRPMIFLTPTHTQSAGIS